MFSNDIDPQNNNYPTMSLQNIGQTSQEQEQPTVCPSCTEKQFMIQQLQEEVNSINTEKYSLKEKLFILKGQMEVLKKRNGELEKTNDNINIMEKYSKIQKQRIKIQKGKGQFQTHHFYSTERALSPNSSVCNTVEDDQISHSQNGNYQYLLDELNQIKLRSMNHHPLSEIFSDTRRRSSPFNLHHFADFQEASHQDMQSFSEYCKTNNNIDYQLKQKNGETVSQFIVDPNSQVKTFNQISFPISNPKQIQSETNSPLEQTQNKQSKPLVFSQIFQQNELVKQNSKENEIAQIQSGTKKKRSSQEKKNFYKHTRHHDYQNSNDQPQYIQVNSIDEDTENNIDSLDNLQRTESSIQNDITVKDQNNGNKSLLGITNTSGVQQSLSELKIKYQHSKKKSELKIQQPLFEDLKCLMSIKDQFVQSFNITSSKLQV